MDLYKQWVCVVYALHHVIVVHRFDSELTQALEEAENERTQKDKAIQECIALQAEIFSLHRTLKVRT